MSFVAQTITNIARNSNIQITLELLIQIFYFRLQYYYIIYSIDIYNNFVRENV